MAVDRHLDFACEFRRTALLRPMAALDIRAGRPDAGGIRLASGTDENVGSRDSVLLNEMLDGNLGVATGLEVGRRWCAPC